MDYGIKKMKSRKEIIEEASTNSHSWGEGIGITRRQDLILEVLLDIRDLLKKRRKTK